jgi:site-specific DNA-methyltransferase (adenine-specific)
MVISEVYNIDNMAYMATCKDKQFSLAICDPDFGLNEKISSGGTWASKYKKGDGNLGGKPTKQYFKDLFRISENQIIWGGNYFMEYLYSTRCYIIWDKVAKMDTLADCEMAWTSFDRNAKIYCHVRNTTETRIHICQKPIDLYKWLLKNYAKEGDKIFDSHMGSQSSRIACYEGGFDYWGCELDKDYFDAGCKRFENYKLQLKLF